MLKIKAMRRKQDINETERISCEESKKIKINSPVLFISIFAGGGIWFLCIYLYSLYKLNIAGFLLVPALFTILFAVLFLSVWIGSVVTGAFDRQSPLYSGWESMFRYFAVGVVAVFFLSMLLEYLYELNPKQKIIEPTSYIFVIDESGSMEGNDPEGLRYEAIQKIMGDPENELPYMVYAFSSESRVLRSMGRLTVDEPEIPVTCDGGTSIRETTLRILEDYKKKKWDGGENPKIIFLTDGYATDLDNGFLWFKGNVPEFNAALEEYSDLGINISTVGLGSVDRQLMRKMAETTGGVFVNVDEATDLVEAMKTAATSYSERNLLSIRYMKHMNKLFGFLRILFLSIIGTLIGGLLALAYMDDNSIPHIIMTSVAESVIGSIILEIGVQNGVYQSILWLLLWILIAATSGYICQENNILFESGIRALGENERRSECQIHNVQEVRNVNRY